MSKGMVMPLVGSSSRWWFTGGEAGYAGGVNDPANKWTRTGAPIATGVWLTYEPNGEFEDCVMVTTSHAGLVDTDCSDPSNDPAIDSNPLCQYFPN